MKINNHTGIEVEKTTSYNIKISDCDKVIYIPITSIQDLINSLTPYVDDEYQPLANLAKQLRGNEKEVISTNGERIRKQPCSEVLEYKRMDGENWEPMIGFWAFENDRKWKIVEPQWTIQEMIPEVYGRNVRITITRSLFDNRWISTAIEAPGYPLISEYVGMSPRDQVIQLVIDLRKEATRKGITIPTLGPTDMQSLTNMIAGIVNDRK